MPTRFDIQTPPGRGAIAVIQVHGDDPAVMELDLTRAGVPVPTVGGLRVGLIAGVDEGVVARWTPGSVLLMPHGGPAVIRAIAARLTDAGITPGALDEADSRISYPEARDWLEAQMLATLARAHSPLAVDVLLEHSSRWRDEARRLGLAVVSSPADLPPEPGDAERARILRRLFDPPLVAALGPPNVGKSTLCNALAGRSVSVVADEAGTTRDHVGVELELAGLVVRYVDMPGMAGGWTVDERGARAGAGEVERAAVAIARGVLARADLVLRCGDAASGLLALPEGVSPACGVIDLGLRVDLAKPGFTCDLLVSAREGRGVMELGGLIRERLVPGEALAAPRPWRFWDES